MNLDDYELATSELRDTADRVQDRQATKPVLKEFDTIAGGRHRAMMEAFRAHRKEPPSVPARIHLANMLAGTITAITHGVGRVLGSSTRASVVEAGRAAGKFFTRTLGGGGQFDDPAHMQWLVNGHEAGQQAARRAAVLGVRDALNKRVGGIVANIGKEVTLSDLLDQADLMLDGSRWMFERVARTEASRAYNTVQDVTISSVAQTHRGMMKRWVELVSDLTGTPLDKRVGKDSIALHGQITRPGGVFLMPASPNAPSRMVGKTWSAPPNRPNDRAVITPWMPDWGVPGWSLSYHDGEPMHFLGDAPK